MAADGPMQTSSKVETNFTAILFNKKLKTSRKKTACSCSTLERGVLNLVIQKYQNLISVLWSAINHRTQH